MKPVPAPLPNTFKLSESNEEQRGERLSKIMAERGLCSRRTADEWISKGWVWVDGERITTLGTRVSPDARISLEKNAERDNAERKTIILHKPIGYVSGQPEPGKTPAVVLITPDNFYRARYQQKNHDKINAADCLRYLRTLAPAGRLDIDSTGLLVLTQDGRIARQLIGEDSHIDKEYLVRVDRLPNREELARLNFGLSLDGQALKRAKVIIQNDAQLMFVLREGKKRQIRRMCDLVGLRVLALKRVRIGQIRLADLPVGQWRFLGDDEHF